MYKINLQVITKCCRFIPCESDDETNTAITSQSFCNAASQKKVDKSRKKIWKLFEICLALY